MTRTCHTTEHRLLPNVQAIIAVRPNLQTCSISAHMLSKAACKGVVAGAQHGVGALADVGARRELTSVGALKPWEPRCELKAVGALKPYGALKPLRALKPFRRRRGFECA